MASLATSQTFDLSGLSSDEIILIKHGVGLINGDDHPEMAGALASLRELLGIMTVLAPEIATANTATSIPEGQDGIVLPTVPYVPPAGGSPRQLRDTPLPGPSDGSFPKLS